jgi:branched-chain amino acid transport system substrate-binding protein
MTNQIAVEGEALVSPSAIVHWSRLAALPAFARLLALLCLSIACLPAIAAELVIAQVAPMTGPLGANGQANFIGAKACFDEVNSRGGINGAKIRFIREDDQYKPDETMRLLSLVAQRDKPVIFLNMLGSASVTAVLKDKTLDRLGIPVVGVTPGAESLRSPGSPWMFHVQAGDRAQIKRILLHLSTLGIGRIAVAYQDIPFGKSGLSFVDELAPSMKVSVMARVAVPSAAEDLTATARQLAASGAQTYLMILVPNSAASLVRDVRSTGDRTPLYGMSYGSVKAIVDKTPLASAVGVALSQVTPNAYSMTSGLARDFHASMDRFAPDGTEHSSLHLVGYLSARVAVEALRKAGEAPSPNKVATALRSVKSDLGGFAVDFTGGSNVGSQFVDIGVLDRNGRLTY